MSSEDPTQVFPKALEEMWLRLDDLEDKVAKRGYDTRPIFEAHEQQLAEFRERIDELEKKTTGSAIGSLKYKKWAYFADDGDGPFCRHCYESTHGKQLSHVTKYDSQGNYRCTICKEFSQDLGDA